MNNEVLLLVGIILVVCEAVKRAGLKTRYVPLLAIFLGIVGSLFFGGADLLVAVNGVLVGLGTTLGFREVKDSLVE